MIERLEPTQQARYSARIAVFLALVMTTNLCVAQPILNRHLSALTSTESGSAGTAARNFLPPKVHERCDQLLASPVMQKLGKAGTALLARKNVSQATEWTNAVLKSLCAALVPVNKATVALVFAMVEKESSFDAYGLLPNQPNAFKKLAYAVIDDLFEGEQHTLHRLLRDSDAKHVATLIITPLKRIGILNRAIARQTFDKYYKKFHWNKIRTEWDVENIVTRDILSMARERTPMGLALKGLFAAKKKVKMRLLDGAIFKSVGPLQVNVIQALSYAHLDGWAYTPSEIRRLLYQIGGGVYYGTRALSVIVKSYANELDCNAQAVRYIAADYTGGLFRSRSAALLNQLAFITGKRFTKSATLDSREVTDAIRALVPDIPGKTPAETPDSIVAEFVKQRYRRSLERNQVYRHIKEKYWLATGKIPKYAMVPDSCTFSPKNGMLCLSDIAAAVERKFHRNCQVLKGIIDGKASDASVS